MKTITGLGLPLSLMSRGGGGGGVKRRRWKRQKDWLDDILKATVRDSLSKLSFVGGFRQPFWHTGFQHRDLVSFRHQNILSI